METPFNFMQTSQFNPFFLYEKCEIKKKKKKNNLNKNLRCLTN